MNRIKNDTQKAWIRKVRAGDKNAFEMLIKDFKTIILRIARGYFLLNGDESDLIQEGRIGLYKACLSYDLESEILFETYANVCIRRNIISAVRSSQNQKHQPLNGCVGLSGQGGLLLVEQEETEEDFEVGIPNGELSPEEDLVIKERQKEIKDKIKNALSDFEFKVLYSYLNGETYKEIAKELDKNEKSIDNAIVRIKAKLKFLRD